MSGTHPWKFTYVGGVYHPQVRSAADYAALATLDQKLWAALACPVAGLDVEEATLAVIDQDRDGRVRAPELLAAVSWMQLRIKDLGALSKRSAEVLLSSLRDDSAEAVALRRAAERALTAMGRTDGVLDLDVVLGARAALDAAPLNGDGVVSPAVVSDLAARALAEDVIATVGAVDGRGGTVGVDQAKLDVFLAEAVAYSAWLAARDAEPAVLALGEATEGALAAVEAVRAKVDDYFGRCRLAAWDARALAQLDRGAEPYVAIGAGQLSFGASEAAALPLAAVQAGRALPLREGVNPAWAAPVAALAGVLERWRGAPVSELTEADWSALQASLAPFQAWQAARPAAAVAGLSVERLAAAVAREGVEALSAVIAQDLAVDGEITAVGELERLVRLHRDLDRLVHNFVSFDEFYSSEMAVFQAGTLYLDGRAFGLCVYVNDAGAHAGLAAMSQAFLAYCELSRPSGEKRTVCAVITDGDSEFVFVGRNGIFYDRNGLDWDARVVKLVQNPISVAEAFWRPYVSLVRAVENMVAARASEAEKASDAKVATAATAAANVDKLEAPEKPARIDVGTVAAMGVAVGALGAFFTTLIGYLTGLFTLPFWQVVLVLAGAVMLVSGPSMLIAWLKLRQRNVGPILDANGWAVNGRMKMGVKFGASMTSVAAPPLGAGAGGADPFSDGEPRWPGRVRRLVILGFLISLANSAGLLEMGFRASGVQMPDFLVQREPEPEPEPAAAPEAEPPPAG